MFKIKYGFIGRVITVLVLWQMVFAPFAPVLAEEPVVEPVAVEPIVVPQIEPVLEPVISTESAVEATPVAVETVPTAEVVAPNIWPL